MRRDFSDEEQEGIRISIKSQPNSEPFQILHLWLKKSRLLEETKREGGGVKKGQEESCPLVAVRALRAHSTHKKETQNDESKEPPNPPSQFRYMMLRKKLLRTTNAFSPLTGQISAVCSHFTGQSCCRLLHSCPPVAALSAALECTEIAVGQRERLGGSDIAKPATIIVIVTINQLPSTSFT